MVIAPPDLQRHPGKSHCLITFSNSAVVWRILSEMFLYQVHEGMELEYVCSVRKCGLFIIGYKKAAWHEQ